MADGYEIRGNSVRVYFRYEGELCREPVGDATTQNIERAKRLVQIINFEKQDGTFDYARHFPNSTKLATNTFGHYANLMMNIRQSRVADSTLRAESSKMRVHIMPRWGNSHINDIDNIALQTWISVELANLSNKTIKEIVSLIKQTYDLINSRKRTTYNPASGIKIRLPDDCDCDPFNLDEIKALTTCDTDRLSERDLIQFMIWDGCRVSEAIALACEDVIDIEKGIIRYRHARVDGKWKVTKTKRSTRTHQLLKPAHEALKRQYANAMKHDPIEIEVKDRDNKTIRKRSIRPLFLRTSGKPHVSDMSLRDRFFKAFCKKAGVRYRPPGNCRHTFISQMLTLGIIPLQWIAKHVGHTTTAMIQKRYGKWITRDGADLHSQIEKILNL